MLAIDSTNLGALNYLTAGYLLTEEYEQSLKYAEKFNDGINASGRRPDVNWLWIGFAYQKK